MAELIANYQMRRANSLKARPLCKIPTYGFENLWDIGNKLYGTKNPVHVKPDPLYIVFHTNRSCVIDLPNGDNIVLPIELKEIADVITKSKYILGLADNWDDEGSEAYLESTWIRAVKFFSNYAKWVFGKTGLKVALPKIYHGPDGTIDILWENNEFTILLNIPKEEGVVATFYGETSGKKGVGGEIDLGKEDYSLLPNLLFW